MTAYLVLRKHPTPATPPSTASHTRVLGGWEKLDTFEAHSAQQAIRKAAEKLGNDANGATFAAVPAGSWAEETVSVAVQTRISFGSAS